MEIKIGKPGRTCTATERPFVHGEQIYSLVKLADQEYHREDYGEESWSPGRADGAIAFWEMTYIDPKIAEDSPPEVFSPMRQLFYESVEQPDRVALSTAYLAAELLRRQKVFRLIKQSDKGDEEGRIALYNDRIGNRLVEVRDPNLSLAELEAGRIALLQRLQELEAPDDLGVSEENAEDGVSEDLEEAEHAVHADT